MQGTILTQFSVDELKSLIVEAIQETLPPPPEKLLSTSEASKYLGITTVTLHAWKKSGKVKAQRLGNALRFKLTELDHLIKEVPRLSNP